MAYILGEGRSQGTLFPMVLDDLVPADHLCRVIDAFVGQLGMENLAFERAQPAKTGRPGYDARAMLKLYLYGSASMRPASGWKFSVTSTRSKRLMKNNKPASTLQRYKLPWKN